VKFASLIGIRSGEILNLKWDAVDLAYKIITVASSSEHRVKHRKMRRIPINDEVVSTLIAVKNDTVDKKEKDQ
jgi:integrase